ncbi:MAG: DUF2029 domain-containing protein [Candidatus Brocadiae bacterium]|nr:DUF2029 domain-containing protein [Candidatus Brocadiia bacterium]
MTRSLRLALWLACGLGIVLFALRLRALSAAFVWGDTAGWAQRPILEVVAWWLGAWLAWAAALRLGKKLPARLPMLVAILLIAGAARASFFGTWPIQEDDAYRYLWDGQQVLEGVNPYRWSPKQAQAAGPDAPEDLRELRAALQAPAAQENHRKINNSSIPTVYPPLNMVVFAGAQAAAPWSLDGLRAAFLILELATIALLWFALRAAGGNPMFAVLYAWCPLPIKEMLNSPHHDALVVCALAGFLLAAVARRPAVAAALLAAAVAAKLYPVVLLPVLLVWAWRRDRRSALVAGGVFAAVLALLYAPFLDPAMFRGTGTFASSWNSNQGAFALLARLFTELFGSDPMIGPLGGQAPRGQLYARFFAAAVVVGAVAAAALARRLPRPACTHARTDWDLPLRSLLVLAPAFALSPAQHPWYFAGILPFVAFFPFRSWILLAGTLSLYYLKFHLRYNPDEALRLSRLVFGESAPAGEAQDLSFTVVRWVEFAPFYALLAAEGLAGVARLWRRPRAGGSAGD